MNGIPIAEQLRREDQLERQLRQEQHTQLTAHSSRACFFLSSFIQIVLPICIVIVSAASVNDVAGGQCPIVGRDTSFHTTSLAPCIFIWVVVATSLAFTIVIFVYRYFLVPGRALFCVVAAVATLELVFAALWLAIVGILIYHAVKANSDMLYPNSAERISVLILALVLAAVYLINTVRTIWKKDVSIEY